MTSSNQLDLLTFCAEEPPASPSLSPACGGGLDDERGALALEFCRLARRLGARWIVWENVVGVLSSNGGRDFGTFLGALAAVGYGFAYRVLDAQFFGVPQRRRRVVVVGYLGDWRYPAAVLFEPESMRRNPAPRRKKKENPAENVAGCLNSSGNNGGFRTEPGEHLVVSQVVPSITTRPWSDGDGDEQRLVVSVDGEISHTLTGEGADASEDGSGRGTPIIAFSAKDYGQDCGEISPTLRAMGGERQNAGGQVAIAQPYRIANCLTSRMHKGMNSDLNEGQTPVISACIDATYGAKWGSNQWVDAGHALVESCRVRRLTPVECERLQGFPDNFTRIPWRGKPAEKCPDGPRYRAIGNSWAVPKFEWLGRRIDHFEKHVLGGGV